MAIHIKKLLSALSFFDSMAPKNFPVHHLQTFLFIGLHEPVTYRDIEEAFNTTNGSASRICRTLCCFPAPHRKNYLKLVDIYLDPLEGRRYKVRLSRKGKSVYKALDILK